MTENFILSHYIQHLLLQCKLTNRKLLQPIKL